ncbi:sensory histidine protein kinase [Roseibium sp. TrichSKD4]|nr:sensory histidine protein kinase [Roseibium sp. TrichSKD4]
MLVMSLRTEIKGLFRSSALRLSLALSVLFVLILLVAGGVAQYLLSEALEDQIDDDLKVRFEALAVQITQSLDGEDDDDEPEFEIDLFGDPRRSDDLIFFASFQTRSGATLGFSPRRLFSKNGYRTIPLKVEASEDEVSLWRIYTGPAAGGRLTVAQRWDTAEDLLELLPGAFIAAGAIATVLTISAGIGFGYVAQRRLGKITRVLDEIAEGNLSARVGALGRRDDLSDLASHIDATTDRLEVLLRQTRELSVNIAHDLKTPLTRLRVRLEALALENEEGRAGETAEHALAELDRILITFDAILQIACMDAGASKKRFEDVDLVQLANELSDAYSAVIEDNGFRFEFESTVPAATVRADPALLKQAIANLIENALRYSVPGGAIRLIVNSNSISVADEGPGIPDEHKLRVLKPFIRLDDARSNGGFGLGLALVQSVAQLHKADVVLADTKKVASVGLTTSLVFKA